MTAEDCSNGIDKGQPVQDSHAGKSGNTAGGLPKRDKYLNQFQDNTGI
jgi:hypothetical protein